MVSIRKAKRAADAKRAAEAAAASLLFCRLNQSPWDVFPSPPPSPPRHAAADDPETLLPLPLPLTPPPPPPSPPFPKRNLGKRTAANVGADESDIKMKKKISVEEEEQEEFVGFKEGVDVVLCPKLDRKGWQCGSVVKTGKLFCDKHLPASSSGVKKKDKSA